MSGDKFGYVIYIRTSPEKLWEALTVPEFTRTYWYGSRHDTTWEPGSSWKLVIPDGRIVDAGTVSEAERPRRLGLRWRHELVPDLRAEGYSQCTLVIDQAGEMTKLTVTHEIDQAGSKFIAAVTEGWPLILSSLKSLLETGEALAATSQWPKDM